MCWFRIFSVVVICVLNFFLWFCSSCGWFSVVCCVFFFLIVFFVLVDLFVLDIFVFVVVVVVKDEGVDLDLLDIRVGKVFKVWKYFEVDFLYVEEVDVGEFEGFCIICSGFVKYVF